MKLISRTHFKRGPTKDQGYQWYWTKQSPNGEPIAVGGEGYTQRIGSYNGFFANEGYSEWMGAFAELPEGYKEEKFTDDHYVITQYETTEEK